MSRTKKPAPRRVYIDTNVLINDFYYRHKHVDTGLSANRALTYLRSLYNTKLLVASFSVVQILSTLSRNRVEKQLIADEIRYVLRQYVVVDVTSADLSAAISAYNTGDLEDHFQFSVCKKLKCSHLLTDNVRDFKMFAVTVVRPKNVRRIALDFNLPK